MNVSFLCVNVSKTFLMTYSRLGSPVNLNGLVTLYGKPVQQVGKLRYLRFIVDCHLPWRNHSEAISAKIARGVRILRRFRHFLPQKILLTLYYPLKRLGLLVNMLKRSMKLVLVRIPESIECWTN